MKIGIDIRPLQGEGTRYRGIGKSMQSFLVEFSKITSRDQSFVFYVDPIEPLPNDIMNLFSPFSTVTVPRPRFSNVKHYKVIASAYKPVRPSKTEIDVLLQYDPTLGIPSSVPSIALFHDLIPLLFQQHRSLVDENLLGKLKVTLALYIHKLKYRRMLQSYKHAAQIIAISDSSRNDLLKYVKGIDPNRVKTIHLGAGRKHITTKTISQKIKDLAKQRYLLYVGGVDYRKNIVGLLKDFYTLKGSYPDLKLVTVGKEFSLKKVLHELGWTQLLNSKPRFAKDVIAPGFLSDQELEYLYRNAVVFPFPSKYEGFGLPVLEAMEQQCPVVAYANSSIIEVAGNAAILVQDGQSLAPAVSKLLDSETLRKRLIKKGIAQANKFTWAKNASETMVLIKGTASYRK